MGYVWMTPDHVPDHIRIGLHAARWTWQILSELHVFVAFLSVSGCMFSKPVV
jgi:hypothetical protein